MTHDDRAKVDEIDKNRSNEASSAKVDKTKNDVIEATLDEQVEVKTTGATKAESAKVPQDCMRKVLSSRLVSKLSTCLTTMLKRKLSNEKLGKLSTCRL